MSKILVSGGLVPTTKDTLLDARTRVATFSEIANIENPARFMVITVEDTGKKYEVRKLSSKIIGGIVVENSTIDINDPEALVDLGLAEELRSEDEKVRQSNESKRIEAENLRKSAEDSRNVNETNRVSAEGVRDASERTRVSSEETRNANEQTRNSNETKRQSQESTRQSQESARQNNESVRNTNESARKEAESERKKEETSRRTAELSRSTAENTRVKNEQNRTTAENTRSSAEDRRVTNETQRTINETARNNAELSREQAEVNRASTFNTLKGQMQTTIQEGKTAVAATEKATSDAQKVVDEYDTKVAEQDSKLTELGSEVDDFKKTITNQVNNYKPIEIHGDVTNAADEEDITSENGLLKFKNRNSLNGMGYVILRRNKSFAEQVTQSNTIYEIRYDFDLGLDDIIIPEYSILDFRGGSITGGSITINEGCTIVEGKFNGTYGIKLGHNSKLKNCVFQSIKKSMIINGDNIIIDKCSFEEFDSAKESESVILGSYTIGKNLYINDCIFKGLRVSDASYSRFIRLMDGNTHFRINNCIFEDIDGNGKDDTDCVHIITNARKDVDNSYPYVDNIGTAFKSIIGEIRNCFFRSIKNAKSIIKIQASNVLITNNTINIDSEGNLDVGIDLVGAIRIINSDNVTIEDNTISFYEKTRGLTVEYSSRVTVRNNRIERKSIEGDSISWGLVRITQTKDVLFESNYIDTNNSWMILAWDNSVNLKIVNNTIIGNVPSGIYIIGLLKKYCKFTDGVVQSTIFSDNNIIDLGTSYSRLLFAAEQQLIFERNTFKNQKNNYTIELDKDINNTNDKIVGFTGNIIAKGKSVGQSKLVVSASEIVRFEVDKFEIDNQNTTYNKKNSILLSDSKFTLIGCSIVEQAIKGINTNNTVIVEPNNNLYNVISKDSQEITITVTNATSQRPNYPTIGCAFFDTTLNKPIWWTGSNWVDATGTAV